MKWIDIKEQKIPNYWGLILVKNKHQIGCVIGNRGYDFSSDLEDKVFSMSPFNSPITHWKLVEE